MREMSTGEIQNLKKIWLNDNRSELKWHEGGQLVGYWKGGDSYVFFVGGHYLAISRGYIVEALSDAPTR